MSLHALIFDFDGTLADTEEAHRQAFNYAFLRLGLKWEWPTPLYRELLRTSGGKERIDHFVESLSAPPAEKARIRHLVPGIHREKARIYAELIDDGRCPLRPGIERLLNEARAAGVRLAIASTSHAENVATLLARHLGPSALPMFSCIVSADHVEHKKPAPDIYRLVLALLGEPANQCVAFEDSANGLRSAKAAGIFTIMTPSQWTTGEDFGDADLVLPHLGDPCRELPACEAAAVGGGWLGLAEICRRHAAATAAVAGKGPQS